MTFLRSADNTCKAVRPKGKTELSLSIVCMFRVALDLLIPDTMVRIPRAELGHEERSVSEYHEMIGGELFHFKIEDRMAPAE